MLSSASKGRERELFVTDFLKRAFPPIYRLGSGEVTDTGGAKTGQLDVVVESPLYPCLSGVHSDDQPRLYLAEGVAAVIEVKSNLADQWKQVEKTGEKVRSIKREFGGSAVLGAGRQPSETMPFFAVGYTGWNSVEAIQKKVHDSKAITGLLILHGGYFVGPSFQGHITATGAYAMWAFVSSLHWCVRGLAGTLSDPLQYISE